MAWPAWAPENLISCTGRDRGDDLRRVRLEGLLREERVVDLRALDPAEAEQRQRLRRDAEDVLEQDDAGRLVRHAGVDLRGSEDLDQPDVGRPRPARRARRHPIP